MIKIIKLPSIIQSHAKIFKKIFKNKAQYSHFKQYLTGLMLCDNEVVATKGFRYQKQNLFPVFADKLLHFRDAALKDQIPVMRFPICNFPGDGREHNFLHFL